MASLSKRYEEWAIKLSEKEALLKSFALFFIVIELFLGFIFYHYRHIQIEHIRENILLEMKNYALSFQGDRFDIDVVPRRRDNPVYTLLEDNASLFMLVPFSDRQNDLLKITYPKSNYQATVNDFERQMVWQFILLSLIAAVVALLFALYTLQPLRRSLRALEGFIKDIIHDLNTPLSALLINLKMLDIDQDERDTVVRNAKAIAMLHRNLESYLKEQHGRTERFDLRKLIDEQVAFFRPMYDYLQWDVHVDALILATDKDAFGRIVYNLLSNACKYNTPDGFIRIELHGTRLTITNDSFGIKHPDRLFERFYKESERGLGIGLHIVAKLCDTLGIVKTLSVKGNIVTVTLDLYRVTLT